MISSKILLQSATAGLMASAILSMPLFVFDSDEVERDRGGCPYTTVQPEPRQLKAPPQVDRHVLRAAPPTLEVREVKKKAELMRRSLEQRNEAARQALQQLNTAYEHSDAQQRGTHMAHTVAAHTMARQTATRVNLQAIHGCRGQAHPQACKQLERVLQKHGPMISNFPNIQR